MPWLLHTEEAATAPTYTCYVYRPAPTLLPCLHSPAQPLPCAGAPLAASLARAWLPHWRLRQLHLPEVYGVKENPLPWLQSMLSGVEHANFFEARATEYSKAATTGAWHGAEGVWGSFDAMMKKRAEGAAA